MWFQRLPRRWPSPPPPPEREPRPPAFLSRELLFRGAVAGGVLARVRCWPPGLPPLGDFERSLPPFGDFERSLPPLPPARWPPPRPLAFLPPPLPPAERADGLREGLRFWFAPFPLGARSFFSRPPRVP